MKSFIVTALLIVLVLVFPGLTHAETYLQFAATTTLVSVSSTGVQAIGISQASAISADGRFVAFTSSAENLVTGDSNLQWDVLVRDQQTSQTTRVSVSSEGAQADTGSSTPVISADGRFVAFTTYATNLVAKQGT